MLKHDLEVDAGLEHVGENAFTLPGFWFRLARAGWVFLAATAVLILILAIPGYLLRRPMGSLGDHLVYKPNAFMQAMHYLNLMGNFIVVLLSCSLGALLFRKRKYDRMALFLAYYLVFHGLLFGGAVEMLEPFWPEAAAVNSFILLPLVNFPLTMILMSIFPDGRFVPAWTRWLLPFTLLLAPFTAVQILAKQQTPSEFLPRPLSAAASAALVAMILAFVWAQIYRYRRVSNHQQRQQVKWVLYGFLIMIGNFVVGTIPWSHALSLPPGTTMPWWLPLVETSWTISVAVLPITLTVSMLRYRLYDVDILISRMLVYGILTASVVAIYVLVVGGLGTLVASEANIIFSLVATGLIAVLFQPLRERLQRGVNKLFYGQRDDPLEALAHLGRRLEAAIDPEVVLPTLVETISQTLKLPYVAISLRSGDRFTIAARTGEQTGDAIILPLNYQGETIGQLTAAYRETGEEFNKADKRLLKNIAHHAGPAVYAVQLTQDLRQSRVHLVTAREEERRRLRRDLHDGLGPVLASQGLKLAAIGELIQEHPAKARKLIENLTEQNEATVAEIRRLVYGLRPAALDELGLVGAIRDYAASLGGSGKSSRSFRVEVREPSSGPLSLPAAIEVAIYRITTEALTNIARHALARNAAVSFKLEAISGGQMLHLEIMDDGMGLPSDHQNGVGMISMRERAEEVGGQLCVESSPQQGTRVIARLPVMEQD